MSNTNTRSGKVKFFDIAKGFGFIKDSETNQEYFVHVSNLDTREELRENDKVTFEIAEGKKGLQAIKVNFAA